MKQIAQPQARLGHVARDLSSRLKKSQKIEWIIRPYLHEADHSRKIKLLDVGTGSGYIAHYFATHPTLRCETSAVDMTDSREIREGFSFQQVSDTTLPFPDETFDVVISNHVIEHVGTISEQAHHLSELSRVLRKNGVIYLAVPNRWMLVEPHYRIAFLSWLPSSWRTPYLRWSTPPPPPPPRAIITIASRYPSPRP
ncbi:MAG: class I SAM-dependent methyltransferase [Zoogloeaceae bacterium]|jgi:ubiquinone/menaquinone biosynthesis C-methylase UbiE|nr:class I SAM-dependent methyltransferase [Zoogloeaceae bacterium]